LIRRGEIEEAQKITERLIDKAEEDILSTEHLTPAEIEEIMKERLAAGESMESIQLKLRENGVKVYKDLEREEEFHDEVIEQISSLKGTGVKGEAIRKHLEEKFSLNAEETEILLKNKLRSKARVYSVTGNITLALGILGLLSTLALGGFSFKAVAVIVGGIGFKLRGQRIKNNLPK
jgi:hypothetical protein